MTDSTISDLLHAAGVPFSGDANVQVEGIAYRSDRVSPGDAFFCIPGFAHDGHDFAADAVARGASVVVAQRELGLEAATVVVADTRVALALVSAAFFAQPSGSFDLVGVTGTNGKTTTTYLLDSIFRADGRLTGLVGTVETRVGDQRHSSARTTPESLDLQRLFAQMRDEGVTGGAIEVSSHAVDLHRVDGTRFSAVGFTNLTQDHLDYHHTLEEYFSVKRRLFTDFEVGARVVNTDDAYGRVLASAVPDCFTVGIEGRPDLQALGIKLDANGSTFTLRGSAGEARVHLPLAGAYNVSNALVAAGCALNSGVSFETVVKGLEHAAQVPGRLERIDCGQDFSVVVDYAHTPDSLEKAIAAVKNVTEGDVIVVFGCGGDRDPDKRPMMGRASTAADRVVITSDNPRSEDPVGIVLQVEDGLRGSDTPYVVEVDRREAIRRAIESASAGDVVLIAGKGHEDYQIFADRTVHFDDREVAREVLG